MTNRATVKKASRKVPSPVKRARLPRAAAKLVSGENPYAVTLDSAVEIAQKAGILTATGKLTRRFK